MQTYKIVMADGQDFFIDRGTFERIQQAGIGSYGYFVDIDPLSQQGRSLGHGTTTINATQVLRMSAVG